MRVRTYRFALRPRWLVGHVLVLAAVVVMVNLGFWQLRRLDERRAANERIEERAAARLAPVEDLATAAPDDVEFRRVEASGVFEPEREVLVGYRTSRGLPGYHVVTPLRLADGRALLVNRGFVPLPMAERWPDASAAPPAGEITVVGVLRRSEDAGDGPVAVRGRTPVLAAIDVDAVAAHVDGDLVPMHVELQQPSPAGYPEPLPPLDLGEGPHLSYALQWFAFSAVASVGWLALLRQRSRREATPPTSPANAGPRRPAPTRT